MVGVQTTDIQTENRHPHKWKKKKIFPGTIVENNATK